MNSEEADRKIQEHLAKAWESLREAEKIANENQLDFYFYPYSNGFYYYEEKESEEPAWESSGCEWESSDPSCW